MLGCNWGGGAQLIESSESASEERKSACRSVLIES